MDPHHHHHHHHSPPPPAVVHHHHEHPNPAVVVHVHDPPSTHKPTYKLFCRAEPNHVLSVRDGKVILARANPADPHQHWYKEEKFSTRVKDEEGLPSFALVNKATGQAIKHSIGHTHPVRLIPHNHDHLDESIMWSESHDTGDNYKAIRMVNNIRLNMDAFHGDKHHGGVHDGTTVVLWEWTKGDNQRWKIVPYCKFSSTPEYPTP